MLKRALCGILRWQLARSPKSRRYRERARTMKNPGSIHSRIMRVIGLRTVAVGVELVRIPFLHCCLCTCIQTWTGHCETPIGCSAVRFDLPFRHYQSFQESHSFFETLTAVGCRIASFQAVMNTKLWSGAIGNHLGIGYMISSGDLHPIVPRVHAAYSTMRCS